MLRQPRPYASLCEAVPFTFPFLRNWDYLFKVEFATSASAPITSYNGEVGSLAGVDSASLMSAAGGELSTSAPSASASRDPSLYSPAALARAAGRSMRIRLAGKADGGTATAPNVAWTTNPGSFDSTFMYGLRFASAVALNAQIQGSQAALGSWIVTAADSYDIYDVVLRSTGAYLFVNKQLVWVQPSGSEASLCPVVATPSASGVRGFKIDYWRVKDLGGVFAPDTVAAVDQASPSNGTDYSNPADQITMADVTASNPLSANAGFYYRHTSANDCWHAYFNASGAVRLDSIASGSATNRINVASAISAGASRTLKVACSGTKHNLYTFNAGVPTKRGSEVNVSNQDSATKVAADIGASQAVANLRSYALTSSNYDELDRNAA